MIAKVFVLLAVVAAAHAGGLIGAPLLAGGHLGVVSAQRTAINHVAPVAAAPVGIAAAPLAYGVRAAGLGYGIGAAGLGYGIGAPLAAGHGLVGGNLRADGIVGSGILGSRYGSAISHNAVVGHGLAGAPLAYGVGAAGLGYGIGAARLGYGYGIGAPLAAGHGLVGGNLRADGIVGSGILGSRYGSAISHNSVVGHGLYGAGLYGAGLHGARLLH